MNSRSGDPEGTPDEIQENDALFSSASLIRGISDFTGDVIYAKDRAGRMRFANAATLALIGKPLADVLGKTDAEFLDDKAAAENVMANDRRIMESGVGADVEEDVPLPDGSRRTWLSRKAPHRNGAGVVTGLLGVSRDVTNEKRAWRRMSASYHVAAALSRAVTLAEVVEATVHEGIAAVGATAGSLALLNDDGTHFDMVGSVGYVGDTIRRWDRFAWDAPIPLAESVRSGQPVYLGSASERLARYPALAALDATGGTRSSASLPLIIGGRTLGTLGLSFAQEGAFDDDQVEFMVALSRQCAQALERARLLEGERRARAVAEHASRMKDEFLATLSHELRTPLNAILGWASILSKGALDDKTLHAGLATIQRNARAQTQIVEDLLDMSRIISGKVRLEVQRTDLVATLQAALDTVRPTAEAKGVRLRSVLDPEAGAVSGDPSRLQQVFWNLLHNAIKFTPKGGQVEVLLARVHSHVEITVSDDGEGITADFLGEVFDRFRQADSSTTRRHGGLGIGLSIVKQLVELHGGTVGVKSEGAGRGATFTVALPRTLAYAELDAADAERRHPSAETTEPSSHDAPVVLAGVRVLVVDDEADARELVRRLLERAGAIVRVAASAREGLALIAAALPDVLVSDIGMPYEDGFMFIRRVRELPAAKGGNLPAVALTAYARTEDRVRIVRAGFQSHIVKPVEAEELLAIVASLTARSSAPPESPELDQKAPVTTSAPSPGPTQGETATDGVGVRHSDDDALAREPLRSTK